MSKNLPLDFFLHHIKMNLYKNKKEVSEAYVQSAIKLDITLVRYLLVSDEIAYNADINFDDTVFSNLCSSDTTTELTKYLFTSSDLKEHLKFSYPGLRSALIDNNVAVTKFLIEKKYRFYKTIARTVHFFSLKSYLTS